jgi:hypothetical protein
VRAIASGETADGAKVVTDAPTSGGDSTQAVRELLKAHKNHEAVAWIAERLPTLEARAAIDVLGAWLARQSPGAAPAAAESASTSAAPASPPQSQAPGSSTAGALAM